MTQACRTELANSREPICPTYYDQNAALDQNSNGLGGIMRAVADVSDMVRAMEECPPLCAADENCKGYVFTPWDFKCWLLASWGVGQFLTQTGIHSMEMVAACRGKFIAKMPPLTVCVNDLSQNKDRRGSELEGLSGVHPPDECARLCAAAKSSDDGSNACVGFVTSPANQCWLKSGWPAEEDNPDRDSVAMTQNCRNELANSGEPICPTYYEQNAVLDQNSNGLGGIMRGVADVSDMVRAMEECPPLCAADENCKGYVFTPWDSTCWLLASWGVGQFLVQSGVHSMQMVAALPRRAGAHNVDYVHDKHHEHHNVDENDHDYDYDEHYGYVDNHHVHLHHDHDEYVESDANVYDYDEHKYDHADNVHGASRESWTRVDSNRV
eukprot:g12649.t1